MSWIPPNIAQSCTVHTTITTCQPQTFLFLQLVAQLFGQSLDSYNYGDFDFNPDFFDHFDHTLSDHLDGGSKPEIYDFIVAGAGSAGCVLANRLTEISHWNVLLLEAGEEEPEVADVPAFAPTIQRSSIDWNFMTQPNPRSCLARRNGQCAWARGKVMGGSSTINYMIYIRGHPKDYDEWAEAGNHGWSHKEILPYFMKSEDNHDVPHVSPEIHGVGGYLSVEQFAYQDANVIAFLKGWEQAGLPLFDQADTRQQIGASLLQTTSRNGRRESANTAFIRPIRRKRPNLNIQTNAYVLRVLIDPHTKKAYGVEYEKNGRIKKALARKEVIVSCGAIMSPKVLMLSGVGPADHLQSRGIEVIKDLAVGYNLQDHTTIDGVIIRLTNKTSTLVSDEQIEQDMYLYKDKQTGPLAQSGPGQLNAFVQTKYEYEEGRSDIQYAIDIVNMYNFLTDPVLAAETRVGPIAYYDGLMIRPILLNPETRGIILLNDTDPFYGHPYIYANTFAENIDLLRLVEGVKQGISVLDTPAMRKIGATLETTPLPACEHIEFGTDEYWACIIQSYTTTIFHFSGTCKMGPKHDEAAVVDPKLRVYGIKNLRVVDASIIPKVMRGNTNAPVMMIAEKASDLIKATWLKPKDQYRTNHRNEYDFFEKK